MVSLTEFRSRPSPRHFYRFRVRQIAYLQVRRRVRLLQQLDGVRYQRARLRQLRRAAGRLIAQDALLRYGKFVRVTRVYFVLSISKTHLVIALLVDVPQQLLLPLLQLFDHGVDLDGHHRFVVARVVL